MKRCRRLLLVPVMAVAVVGSSASAHASAAPSREVVAPLTGLPVDDAAALIRPALVIPIDNWGAQGPHAGLNEADLVFELMADGRATRMLAVFHSRDADPVGPIRSGRTQDVLLFGCLNDPVFAHSGGNQHVVRALAGTGWTVLDQSDGMFRSDEFGNSTPHNLYANTSELFSMAGESGSVVPQFGYLPPGEHVDGPEVNDVALTFGNNSITWSWDATADRYSRTQSGRVHETATGPVNATTVIVIAAPYLTSQTTGSPEAQTVGSGDAVVYADGQKVEGTWTRETPTSTFMLEADGEPILIPPGRTWIEVIDVETDEIVES